MRGLGEASPGIDVRLGLREPEEELGKRILQRVGEDDADLLRRSDAVTNVVLE